MKQSSTILTSLFLAIIVLCLMSFPETLRERVRGRAIALLSPFWKISKVPLKALSLREKEEELLRLQTENRLLAEEVDLLRERFQYQMQLLEEDQNLSLNNTNIPHWNDLYYLQLQSLPAKVIFRPQETWGSFLWIDLGEEDNSTLSIPILRKHSPVVLGNSLVGVVDFVGKQQSRVRLIADRRLCPSVRIVRGGVHHRLFSEKLDSLLYWLQDDPSMKECKDLIDQIRAKLPSSSSPQFLAKGELCGAKEKRNMASLPILQGTGFNYDFADEHGPARDLRTGNRAGEISEKSSLALVQEGDLLLTSGLDGIFPPGLFVARVTQVSSLKEGDYYIDLEAVPNTVENLQDLSTVFVLPPYQEMGPPLQK